MQSSQQETLKQLKQSFLRQQILAQNYDPQDFIFFLNSRLHIDSDINRCSLEQLKQVVGEYLNQKENNIIEQIGKVDEEDGDIIKKIKESKSNTILLKNYSPPIVQEEFQTQFKCLKVCKIHPDIPVSKIVCFIDSPERKYMGGVLGIGGTSFLQFRVHTPAVGWSVGRRYSDFVWLRLTLRKFFPTIVIPPIPEKKAAKKTVRHVQKRMRILQYFVNQIIKIPELANCKYVQGFLSLTNSSKFQSLKKQADNMNVFESITSTLTQTGNVSVALTPSLLSYSSSLSVFVAETQPLLKSLTRNSKALQSHLVGQVNTIYEMGNQLASFYESTKKFSETGGGKQNEAADKLGQIIIKLNNMMVQWGNMMKNEVEMMEINFNTFLKYCRQSYVGFKELLSRTNQLQMEFAELKMNLDRKKQKIFLLHDTSKWQLPKKDISLIPKSSIHQRSEAFKLMLPRQSVECQKAKMDYCFHLSRLRYNSNESLLRKVDLFRQNFKQFVIKNKVCHQQLVQMWGQMGRSFSEEGGTKGKVMKKQLIPQQNNDIFEQ